MHIKTVILLGNFFLFALGDVVNLSTTFFIQRFLRFLFFFIKNAFLTFFILGVNVFYIYGFNASQRLNLVAFIGTFPTATEYEV